MILQFKIDEGSVHRPVTRNSNRIIAVHVGWIVVRISRTFYCVINHRITSCSRKGIYIIHITVTNGSKISIHCLIATTLFRMVKE